MTVPSSLCNESVVTKSTLQNSDVHFIAVAVMRLSGYWDLKNLLPLNEIWPVFSAAWDSYLMSRQLLANTSDKLCTNTLSSAKKPQIQMLLSFSPEVLVSIHTIFSYLTQYIYFISINRHSVHSFHQGNEIAQYCWMIFWYSKNKCRCFLYAGFPGG